MAVSLPLWLEFRSRLVSVARRSGFTDWWRHWQNKRYWERQWGQSDFAAPWLGRGVSPEIIQSIDDGWIAPSGTMLDIGCGEGEVAAFFAERGYEAVGMDISAAAIRRARDRFRGVAGKLHFTVHDLCAGPPPGGPFDLLIDRGCFHQILEVDRRGFAANLAAVAAENARMLLFLKAFRAGQVFGDPAETKRGLDVVGAAFAGRFAIERFQPTYLDPLHGTDAAKALPGLVFWMHRLAP